MVPCSTTSSVVIFCFSFRKTPGGLEPPSRALQARAYPCSATVPEPPRGVEPLRAGSKPAALPTELRRQAGAASAPGSSGRSWRRRKRPLLRQQFLKAAARTARAGVAGAELLDQFLLPAADAAR